MKESSEERKARLGGRAARISAEAHDRVVKDGTIQFRLDGGNMETLLRLSKEKGLGIGVLARMWVMERLNEERSRTHVSTVVRWQGRPVETATAPIPVHIASLSEAFISPLVYSADGFWKSPVSSHVTQPITGSQTQPNPAEKNLNEKLRKK